MRRMILTTSKSRFWSVYLQLDSNFESTFLSFLSWPNFLYSFHFERRHWLTVIAFSAWETRTIETIDTVCCNPCYPIVNDISRTEITLTGPNDCSQNLMYECFEIVLASESVIDRCNGLPRMRLSFGLKSKFSRTRPSQSYLHCYWIMCACTWVFDPKELFVVILLHASSASMCHPNSRLTL